MSGGPSHPTLALLVLRCGDIDKSRGFYEALGLPFQEEKHGSGPRHFSAELASLVLELYPASERFPAECLTRLGFQVNSVRAAEQRLRQLGLHVPLAEADVVLDPDQRRVQLVEPR